MSALPLVLFVLAAQEAPDAADASADPPPAPVVETAAPPVEAPATAKEIAAAPQETRPLRLAVYDFAVEGGVEPRVARVVSESTVTELRKLEGVLVVSMDEVRAMIALETEKQLMGCTDDSCLAEIGDALGVDGLIVGQLISTREGSVFVLRRIDQRDARVAGSVSKRLDDANGEEFLAVVGPSVAELFPDFPLRKGQRRGVDPQVALLLNPPPLPSWIFWTTTGVAGAGAATSAATLALALAARGDLEGYVARPLVQGAEIKAKQDTIAAYGWSAAAFAAATGALVVTAVMLAPFTDFDDIAARGVE